MPINWSDSSNNMGFTDLSVYPVVAYDTETTGTRYPKDKVFGFSLACPDGKSGYFDIREQPQAKTWLNEQMKKFKGTIVCHNASFDYRLSLCSDLFLPLEQLDDTLIRACCLDEHEATIFPWTRGRGGDYSLDYLSQKYLGAKKYSEIYTELAQLFGGRDSRKAQIVNLWRAPSELVAKYAIPDAQLTLDLWLDQEDKIKRRKLQQIVEFERKLMPTLIRCEARGIRIDVDRAEEAYDRLGKVLDVEKKKLFNLAGTEFNPNSPKEVRSLFDIKQEGEEFFARDGTKLELTPSGQPSLGKPVLEKMSDPVAKQLIHYRSMLKTRDTFLANHVLGSVIDGRVYPNINQMKGENGGTGTGRLSYTSPALQQIPSRNGDVAKIIKPCFLPEEGQLWLESDMNSFEVRVFAHLVSNINPQMMHAYKEQPKLDFHQWAADLAGITRSQGKTLNLAMLYRQGKGASAELMGLPWEWAEFENKKGEVIRYKKAGYEAESIIETYHANIKGVKEIGQKAELLAIQRGFVQTAHGRRLRFPKGYKAYKASAILCQATAADENKENWLKIEEALGNDGTLLLNTHDSYSMSVSENWRPVWERVKKAVEKQTLNVPLILDFEGVGKNWAEAKGLV